MTGYGDLTFRLLLDNNVIYKLETKADDNKEVILDLSSPTPTTVIPTTISEEDCKNAGDYYLKIIYNINNNVYKDYISVSISKEGELIYSKTGENLNDGITTDKICVKKGDYTFVFGSNTWGWASNSVSVELYDTILIESTSIGYNGDETKTISLRIFIHYIFCK